MKVQTNEYTGKPAQKIKIRATDDFRGYRVVVSIYSATGVLMEEMNALQSRNGIEWVYTTRADDPDYKGGTSRK